MILEIIFPDKFLFQDVVVAITTNGNAEIRNLNVKLFRKSTATLIIIFPSFVAYKPMAMLFLLYSVTYMYYSFVIYQCQCLVIILYIIGGIIMTKDFIVRPKYTDKKRINLLLWPSDLNVNFRKNMINYLQKADVREMNWCAWHSAMLWKIWNS